MKIKGALRIGSKDYKAGDEIAWHVIYPFFLFHMFAFGTSGFVMAYFTKDIDPFFLFIHGGIAIVVYTVFYLSIFGLDEIKWMFINAGLGILGIYSQVGWLLSIFGKNIKDYPLHKHIIPFLYYTLYTFLIRQAFMDILGAREDEQKRMRADQLYLFVSIGLSLLAIGIG